MTENSLTKKQKLSQKQKEKIEFKGNNLINFQEPKEEPINQIRNSTTLTGVKDEYNDNIQNLLQVELGDDIIINNHLQENLVDNINHEERIKFLMNVNKNEQIDFINTLLRLKGINNNAIFYDNDNENNLAGINRLISNIKPDDDSKSYFKEILDIYDDNNLNNYNIKNSNILNNNELNSISLSINNGKNNLITNNNIYNNIYPVNKNDRDKGLKTRDLLEIANRRKRMDKNFDSMTPLEGNKRRRHLEEVTSIERLKKERNTKNFFTPQISKRSTNIGNKKNAVSLTNLDSINLEQVHFSNINLNYKNNNMSGNINNSFSNNFSNNIRSNNKMFVNVKSEKKDVRTDNIGKFINNTKGINDNNNHILSERSNKSYNSYRDNISDKKSDINFDNDKSIFDKYINKRKLISELKENESSTVKKYINKNNNFSNNNKNNNNIIIKNQRKKNEIEQNINFNYLQNKDNRDYNFESKDFEVENNINSDNYIPVESRLFYSTDELEQEQSMLKKSNMNFKTSINESNKKNEDKLKINLKEIKRQLKEKEENEKILNENQKINDSNNYINQIKNENNNNNDVNNSNLINSSSSSKKRKIKKIAIINMPSNLNINNETPLMPYELPLKLEINNQIYLPNNQIIEAPPTKSEVVLSGFPNKQMLITPVINNQIMIPQNQLEKQLSKNSYKTNSPMNNDIVNYISKPSQNMNLISKTNSNKMNNENDNNIIKKEDNNNNIINEEKTDLSSIIQFNPDLESNLEFQIQDAQIGNSMNNNLNLFSSSSFNIINNRNSNNNNNNINNNITTSSFSNNFMNDNNENNENVESINGEEESLVSDVDYFKNKKQNETTEIKISQIQKDLFSNYNSNGNNSINLSKLTNFVDYNSNNSKVLSNQNSKKVFSPKSNYYNSILQNNKIPYPSLKDKNYYSNEYPKTKIENIKVINNEELNPMFNEYNNNEEKIIPQNNLIGSSVNISNQNDIRNIIINEENNNLEEKEEEEFNNENLIKLNDKLDINDLNNSQKENFVKAEINLFDDDEDEKNDDDNIEYDNIIKEVHNLESNYKKNEEKLYEENYLYNNKKINLNKFINSVVPIEENKIEFDIDDLVTPKYMFNNTRKNNNSINNKNDNNLPQKETKKNHYSHSFCENTTNKKVNNSKLNHSNISQKYNKNKLTRITNIMRPSKKKNSKNLNKKKNNSDEKKNSLRNLSNNTNHNNIQNKSFNYNNNNNLSSNKFSQSQSNEKKKKYKFIPRKKKSSLNNISSMNNLNSNLLRQNINNINNSNYENEEEDNLSFDNYFKKLLKSSNTNNKINKANSLFGKTENIVNLNIKDDIKNNLNNNDMNRFSVDSQQNNNNNKINVNEFITNSIRIQRENQDKYRKKISENLALISESQEKNENELKDDINNFDNDNFLGNSISSTFKKE